jgi:hypothetical protein
LSLKTLICLVISSEYLAEISSEKVVLFESRASFDVLLSFFQVSHLLDLLLVISLRRWIMNHPLISGLKKVILVRMMPSSRPQIGRAERKVAILTEDLLVDLGVSESLLLLRGWWGTASAKINFLKICVFHIVPVNVGEIQILVELLGILASLHLSSLLDGGVFELLESVLGKR